MANDDIDEHPPEHHPAPSTSAQGGNFLTHRIGPLPVYGWIVAAIGAYLLYHWLKNRNASSTQATTPDSGITPSLASSPDGGSPPTTQPGMTNTVPVEAWLSRATHNLATLGYDPKLVETSLRRYLSGEQLDEQEWHVVEAAINTSGQPQTSGTLGQLVPPRHTPKSPRAHVPSHRGTPPPQRKRAIGY